MHSVCGIAIDSGRRISNDEALRLADCTDLDRLMAIAAGLRDDAHGNVVSFSRKVFLPVTHLCRDRCGYCTFAEPPRAERPAYMSIDQVLAESHRAARAGCKEALFTLGEKPELRYVAAQKALAALGHATTLSYIKEVARRVIDETGLLPHLNPGLMSAADLAELRPVSASMGLMLESTAERLSDLGGPHYGCPDKLPSLRLETIALGGEARIPFTSGLLIGIGETRRERIDALLALRALAERYGHLQEVIIQNFCAKPRTKMADSPSLELDDLLWTIAIARIVLGGAMNLQAPPNLSPNATVRLIDAGINDWGGVSPVTPDFVNPEAPWPTLDRLARDTARAGKVLVERLCLYPAYAQRARDWVDEKLQPAVQRLIDSDGFARIDPWSPGAAIDPPPLSTNARARASAPVTALLDRARWGNELSEAEVVRLFRVRGDEFDAVVQAADALRAAECGDTVTYIVNRNINYTNVCTFQCRFCAFSHGKVNETLRGAPYRLDLDEIAQRTAEAWARGATEVCLQGGIHPDYTGDTYIEICRAVKSAAPAIHVHAFSPLEVWHGATTLGLSVPHFLERLQRTGLSTLPGTAAEILDDEVRAMICPDKINTAEWLEVMESAHRVGLRSTATIMFGHVDEPIHWARHLLRIRTLQARTGGFSEFVPLPFVHMESPIYLKGRARRGPTFREALLMHAVARLVLHPLLRNIQASWVKMGPRGAATCLATGANDLGGTLMNESITRAAGAAHGQELGPSDMERLIRDAGRKPRQRTTLYSSPAFDSSTAFGTQTNRPDVVTGT